MRRALLCCLAALATLLLAACLGEETEGPREAGTDDGLTLYEVDTGSFSIAVPAGWGTLSAADLVEAGGLDAFAEENPEFGPYLEALDGPDSPVKFVALDPDVRQGFTTNLLVSVERLPDGVTLEAYEEANRSQIRALGNLKGRIAVGEAALPAGKARTISYRMQLTVAGVETTFSTRQYYLVDGGRGYILTFTTLPGLAGDYAERFARSAGTFTLR